MIVCSPNPTHSNNVHNLITGTYEYVTYGRSDLRILGWEDQSKKSRWTQCNQKELYKGKWEGHSQKDVL